MHFQRIVRWELAVESTLMAFKGYHDMRWV